MQFFYNALSNKKETRTKNRRARYQKNAHFPVPKSFNNFDFSNIEFPKKISKEKMLSLQFITNKEVILCFGGCGSGKTHMITALGILACNNDYRVKFYTVSQLVILLKKAKEENNLDKITKC